MKTLLFLAAICLISSCSTAEEELAEKGGHSFVIRVQERMDILKGKDGNGNETTTPILLNRRTARDGDDIAVAVPSANQPDAVDVTLDHTGADKMIALTRNMRPGLDRIAIVLDGEVVSAPVLTQTPLGKHFMSTGLDGSREA